MGEKVEPVKLVQFVSETDEAFHQELKALLFKIGETTTPERVVEMVSCTQVEFATAYQLEGRKFTDNTLGVFMAFHEASLRAMAKLTEAERAEESFETFDTKGVVH